MFKREGDLMRKSERFFTLGLLVIATTILIGCSVSHAQDTEEAEAKPAEFERLVELEKTVHFLTPAGEDVAVSPGTYSVEAANGALRLTSNETEDSQPVTIQAEATTHTESVETPEPIAIPDEDDQQVILLLMPEGKALQSVGSLSGVRERGMRFRRSTVGPRTLTLIPQIKGIFTVPRLGAISPNGRLYIRGKGFGKSKGKIILSVKNLSNTVIKYPLTVEQWSDTKIKATIPLNISRVPDHKASFVLKTTKGLGSRAWTVNFYAKRDIHWLKRDEVRVKTCSRGADHNVCNGWNQSDPGACTFSNPKLRTDATFTIMHLNCDVAVDWDDGTDVLEVRLKNGWVIDRIDISGGGSSSSEKLRLPTQLELKRSTYGTSVWKQKISWEVSPGKDYVLYSFWVKIKGPEGLVYR
jgi:hypothetical protein